MTRRTRWADWKQRYRPKTPVAPISEWEDEASDWDELGLPATSGIASPARPGAPPSGSPPPLGWKERLTSVDVAMQPVDARAPPLPTRRTTRVTGPRWGATSWLRPAWTR